LSGTADDGRQILAHDSGGQNLGVARLLPVYEEGCESDYYDSGENNEKNLLHVRVELQKSPISVYAIVGGWVPVEWKKRGVKVMKMVQGGVSPRVDGCGRLVLRLPGLF
jgi:hypothetical protein